MSLIRGLLTKKLFAAMLVVAPVEWSIAETFDVAKRLPELECELTRLDATRPRSDLEGDGKIWILVNEGPAPVTIQTESDAALNVVIEPYDEHDLDVFVGDRRYHYTIGLAISDDKATVHACVTFSALELVEKAMAAHHRGDDATAVTLIKGLAEQGIPLAQFQLGVMYSGGIAVPSDLPEAVKWYRLAAEQGYAPAQTNLGTWYSDGIGVEQDFSRAVKWYRLAADQGYAPAQHNLGAAYGNGTGVTQDYAEAARWVRRAAEQGFPPAQVRLGVSYLHGVGVTQDAAEGVKWFKLAADQDFSDAQYELGVAYYNGIGVPQDYSEAVKWYRLAADQGNALAQHGLGASYANGTGLPQDFAKAYMWSTLAAERGIEDAKTNLYLLRNVTSPDERTEAERLAREWTPKVTGPSIVRPSTSRAPSAP